MEGLARPAGSWVSVKIEEGPYKGEWKLGGMQLDDYGVVEQELLKRQRTPLEALDKAAEKVKNPKLLQMIARLAYNDLKKNEQDYKIPVQDVYDWLDSVEGLIFTAWLCFGKNHPGFTMEQAKGIMNALGQQQFKRLRDQASGTDERGNATGPTQEGEGSSQEDTGSNGFPGNGTTVSLPTNTGGPLKKSASSPSGK
jgi:hypothetical protein